MMLRKKDVVESRWETLRDSLENVITDDHKRHTARADILLGTGVDQGVFRNIDGFGEYVRRCVADDRQSVGLELIIEFDALDRFVRGVMYECGVLVEPEVRLLGNVPKAVSGVIVNYVRRTELCGFR